MKIPPPNLSGGCCWERGRGIIDFVCVCLCLCVFMCVCVCLLVVACVKCVKCGEEGGSVLP